MFGSVSRSRSRRFVISPWIGIFVRLKPQCANACGNFYCPERYCPRFRNQKGPDAHAARQSRQPQVEFFFRLERLEATQTESLESTPAETHRSLSPTQACFRPQ